MTVVPPVDRPESEYQPVGGPVLDLWTSGLNEAAAGAAVVAAGIDLAMWQHWVRSPPATADSEAYVRWRLDPRQLKRKASRIVADLGLQSLLVARPEDAPASFLPFLRLAVSGNVIPADVVPRYCRRQDWRQPL